MDEDPDRPATQDEIRATLDLMAAELARLRAALAHANWMVKELRGQRDCWKVRAERGPDGEF